MKYVMEKKLTFQISNVLSLNPFKVGDRFSIWVDGHLEYLMPSEIDSLTDSDGQMIIQVTAQDPNNLIEGRHVQSRFLFGHPGRIIGEGILEDVRLFR